jgi:mannose-1-phosphate guanylyltransferase
MFCFAVGDFLSEAQEHAPLVLEAVQACMGDGGRRAGVHPEIFELDQEKFRHAPDISIDYAIMEKSRKVAVVACNPGWSDIGSWNAISELVAPDESGNRVIGEAFLHDVKNCYIQADGRLVGAIGIENLVVVDTPDALLLADRDRVQEVKDLAQRLKQSGHETYRLHRTAHRPWGTYTVLEEGSRFKIKRIVVKPGASLSLQMHHHRSEHWIVVSGMAKVVNGEREIAVNTNESTYIPAGHKHRLENPGVIDLVMIEVQVGEYLGEDDIVRFQDNYGRS